MIDHVGIAVRDLEKSKRFYERAFDPLGYSVAFGEEGQFWAFDVADGLFEIMQAEIGEQISPIHVAFRVSKRDLVGQFHEAALAAGAKDNGAPGPRPEYTPNYYACFVLDPDGNNIEVMTERLS